MKRFPNKPVEFTQDQIVAINDMVYKSLIEQAVFVPADEVIEKLMENDMTIEQVKAEKRKMEKIIEDALNEFTKITTIKVTSIYLSEKAYAWDPYEYGVECNTPID